MDARVLGFVLIGMVLTKVLENLFKDKHQKWWEKEAEERGVTAEEYLKILKLEKENAELEVHRAELEVHRIVKRADELKNKLDRISRNEKWELHWEDQLKAEQQKIDGYKEVAKVNSAYISILLKRLGATEDNKVDVKATEITEALEKYETRAEAIDGGFALYYTE